MSTDNDVTVTITRKVATTLVSCDDPRSAAEQAVKQMRDFGQFDGEVFVTWKANHEGRGGFRKYQVKKGQVLDLVQAEDDPL